MFRNKNLVTVFTVLTIAAAVLIGSTLYANEWDGDWYGEGRGSVIWGIYTIYVFCEWEMNILNGVVTGEWWDGPGAYGDIAGTVYDNTDHGIGTWDVDNPYGCPLHGTWEADFYIEDDEYRMDGDWWYYNLLGQKVHGGEIWGNSPRGGIPED